MERRKAVLALSLGLAVAVLTNGSVPADGAGAPDAETILADAVTAYSTAQRFAGTMRFEVTLPDGRTEKKAIEYGRDGADAYMAMVDASGTALMRVVATGGRLYATQFNVARSYVSAPLTGDFASGLVAIGADQVGLKPAPPLAAAVTGSREAFVDALGFGILGPLEPTAVEEDSLDGRVVRAVTLTADNGSLRVSFDTETHELLAFALTVGAEGHQVSGSGVFEKGDPADLASRLSFDPGDRTAVADFAALEASAYPLGTSAPEARVATLGGEAVELADLRGSVVVLDFWATWCVPCWSALEEIEQLAAWVETSGHPIEVYAVSTLETFDGMEEQSAAVTKFLAGRGLEIPVALDVDGSFFRALHSPGLPSTVVIAPDGTLARYHSGVMEEMFEALQAEVLELLPPG